MPVRRRAGAHVVEHRVLRLPWSLVEGEAEVSISKVPHRVRTGDLLRLPANEPHALKAITPFKMILVMVKA